MLELRFTLQSIVGECAAQLSSRMMGRVVYGAIPDHDDPSSSPPVPLLNPSLAANYLKTVEALHRDVSRSMSTKLAAAAEISAWRPRVVRLAEAYAWSDKQTSLVAIGVLIKHSRSRAFTVNVLKIIDSRSSGAKIARLVGMSKMEFDDFTHSTKDYVKSGEVSVTEGDRWRPPELQISEEVCVCVCVCVRH